MIAFVPAGATHRRAACRPLVGFDRAAGGQEIVFGALAHEFGGLRRIVGSRLPRPDAPFPCAAAHPGFRESGSRRVGGPFRRRMQLRTAGSARHRHPGRQTNDGRLSLPRRVGARSEGCWAARIPPERLSREGANQALQPSRLRAPICARRMLSAISPNPALPQTTMCSERPRPDAVANSFSVYWGCRKARLRRIWQADCTSNTPIFYK